MSSVEPRVNQIRIIALATFYLLHVLAYYGQGTTVERGLSALLQFGAPISQRMHIAVSVLIFGWLMQALAIHVLSNEMSMVPWLAPSCIVLDTVWLTCILCVSNGPGSTLTSGYFLILASGALRMNLRWVRLATVSCVLGYLVVLGCAKWPVGMLENMPTIRVARYQQVAFLCALVFAGVLSRQTVRAAYALSGRALTGPSADAEAGS